MRERIKFIIIRLLDRKEDTCWANMAMCALGYQTFWETFGANGDWKIQLCRERYCKGTPWAYCGKCERTGRFYSKKGKGV